MFHVLIDTSVWLDLAQDPKQTPLLLVVENLVKAERLKVIVPQIIVEEFRKNRDRVAKSSSRSLSGHFQQVKDALNKASIDAERKNAILSELEDLNHQIPLIGGAAAGVLDRVEELFKVAGVLPTDPRAVHCAALRALSRRAPCHHENKNSIADAVVIETYLRALQDAKAGERFAFVTHNKSDFSLSNGNQKLPHPDLEEHFSKIKSMYFINLAELLRKIDPSLLSELLWEQTWEEQPRGLHEILASEELLYHQVWFNRHMNLRWRLEHGKVKIVSHEEWERLGSDNSKYIVDSVYEGAKAAADATLKQYGQENFGPWDDFEWGMINGKLSALRWVLGDEWDMLDT